MTIGIKFDQPGLGQQVGNEYKGFDVSVAQYVAKELGYTNVTFKESPSAQRETLLESGQVQMIFATYSITDDRKQKVSFAGPYFIAGQDLLVKSDNTDITGPDSLNGKKLCSVTGSTSATKVKDQFADKVQLQEYDTYSKCVEALNSGRIDAVTTDNVILAGFAAQSQYQGKLKVVGKTFSTEKYGVGIKKGDTELCGKVNTALEKMVSDGSWQKALDDTVGASGLQARHRDQSAQARRLLLIQSPEPGPLTASGSGADRPATRRSDGRTAHSVRDLRHPRRVLDDGEARVLRRHRVAADRDPGRRLPGLAGRRAAWLRHHLRQPDPQHPADPDRLLLRVRRREHARDLAGVASDFPDLRSSTTTSASAWSGCRSITRPSSPRPCAAA